MEVYVEFKPCYFTIPDVLDVIFFRRERFIDGKADDGRLFLTDDCKFVCGFYNGAPTYFRVCNISSTPIVHKTNKVKIWNEYTERINSLIKERSTLTRQR